MELAFVIIATVTLGGAVAVMSLRHLVHCALALVVTFAGLGAMYLMLSAEFVAFVQLLVYIGAVAILIVFALLLTRSATEEPNQSLLQSKVAGVGIALLAFGTIVGALLSSGRFDRVQLAAPMLTVKRIGEELMTRYVLPLEAIGLLLTAATIGAVVIAMEERKVADKSKSAEESAHTSEDKHG
ncbi:MAG TPA: NADH-quinone oxidoreductase subunit J [Verrucomicrobiae bacterium]